MNAENKKNAILTDEELANVSGGGSASSDLRERGKKSHTIPKPPTDAHISSTAATTAKKLETPWQ